MTIGLAFLLWFIAFITAVVFTIISAALLDYFLNDFLDFMLVVVVYVVAVLLQLSLIVILVWWVYAMITQGINPIDALSYTMW